MFRNNTEEFKKIAVPFETLQRWQSLCKPGDKVFIAKKYFLTKSTVSFAFKGQASPDTINKINHYFDHK